MLLRPLQPWRTGGLRRCTPLQEERLFRRRTLASSGGGIQKGVEQRGTGSVRKALCIQRRRWRVLLESEASAGKRIATGPSLNIERRAEASPVHDG